MRRSQDNRHRIDSANQLPQIPETAKLLFAGNNGRCSADRRRTGIAHRVDVSADEETEKEHLRLLGIVSA